MYIFRLLPILGVFYLYPAKHYPQISEHTHSHRLGIGSTTGWQLLDARENRDDPSKFSTPP